MAPPPVPVDAKDIRARCDKVGPITVRAEGERNHRHLAVELSDDFGHPATTGFLKFGRGEMTPVAVKNLQGIRAGGDLTETVTRV